MTVGGTTAAKKVMVVADPTRESAGALQYALSHAVVEKDELILLHVENHISWQNMISAFLKMPSLGIPTTTVDIGGGGAAAAGGEVDFLEEMKRVCQIAQPKIQVRTMRVETDGMEKANVILSQSKIQKADVLVIGQRRNISTAILGLTKLGGSTKGAKVVDTAEYLIENSTCTCVAVQKKGQKAGYVLNSKTHRNFWLLA